MSLPGLQTDPLSKGESTSVRIAALGDLMLNGEWEEIAGQKRMGAVFSALRSRLADHDIVFANLETTVAGKGGLIVKQPRVVARAESIRQTLTALSPHVVNLANNHAFDAYDDGFYRTRRLLEELGIQWLGAGANSAEAARPCRIERRGIRFGWLAYAAPETKPSHLAQENRYGVNPLCEEQALADVADLKSQCDHVLVSLHWGVEYCHLPSPAQVRFARSLVDGGASAVIGHHVHVVQGYERWRRGVIAYNLGNATTTDHYIDSRRAIRQTPRTRSSYVLDLDFSKTTLENVNVLPFRTHRGAILLDDRRALRYLSRANRYLERGISESLWRRRRLLEDVVLRTARKLHPAVIASVRPSHLTKLFRNFDRALRGSGPV